MPMNARGAGEVLWSHKKAHSTWGQRTWRMLKPANLENSKTPICGPLSHLSLRSIFRDVLQALLFTQSSCSSLPMLSAWPCLWFVSLHFWEVKSLRSDQLSLKRSKLFGLSQRQKIEQWLLGAGGRVEKWMGGLFNGYRILVWDYDRF